MRTPTILIASFGLVSSLFVIACGSKDEPAAACPKFDYSTYMPQSMTLTFATDIMPIVTPTCATAKICHGSPSATMVADNEPQMGSTMGTDAAGAEVVRMALVSVASAELPSMPYVTPGDPDKSWLMKKIERVQSCGGFSCVAGVKGAKTPCGDPMPGAPAEPLPADQVAKFRDWIKAGAK